MNKRGDHKEIGVGLTNRKRFASGLDVAYLITFLLGIHSEKIRKRGGSVDTETPNKGKMFGWDKCFHRTTSRQKRWFEIEVGQ